jgi:polyhydroxybutyrate depolymerase
MIRSAVVLVFGCAALASAAESAVKKMEWKVGGETREALVHAPAKAAQEPCPLVFVFHGHGGTMTNAAARMAIHDSWPEAICVYPQGLPTPGKLTDPQGKRNGWQSNAGEQGDRDLKFFDQMLKSLRTDYKVDDKRVFVTGHSNGGRFTQLLWAERGDAFAAVAPSGTTASTLTRSLKPKPCLHVAGERDELVKFAWQQQTMDAVRKLNGCDADGGPWQKDANPMGTLYPSKTGTPFVALVYPGGHAPPADTPKRIAAFFKEQAKK